MPCWFWCRFSSAIQVSLCLHGVSGGSGSSETGWLGPEGLVWCGFGCFFSSGFFPPRGGLCFTLFSLVSVFVRNPGVSVPPCRTWGFWKLGNAVVGSGGARFVWFSLFFLVRFHSGYTCNLPTDPLYSATMPERSWCTPGAQLVHTWSAPGALQVCSPQLCALLVHTRCAPGAHLERTRSAPGLPTKIVSAPGALCTPNREQTWSAPGAFMVQITQI